MRFSAPYCIDGCITTTDFACMKASDSDMEDCEIDELVISALLNDLPLSCYAMETIKNDYEVI